MPIIKLLPDAEVKLTAWAIATNGLEFSGLGLIEKQGDVFYVVDVDLLGVGSVGFTEFSPERQRMLPEDPRRKLWFHRHPIMNWSTTDEQTATQEPLGTDPKLVQWSVAIVLTPGGWIGRVDVHVPKLTTFHCPVEPRLPNGEALEAARQSCTPQLAAFIEELKAEYRAMRPGRYEQTTFVSRYEYDGDRSPAQPTGYFCPDCTTELQEAEMEFATDAAIQITLFECPDCGCLFYTHGSDDAVEISARQQRKTVAAWRKSFNTWRDKRRS